MPANLDALPERVEAIERKVDSLSKSVDRRFDEVSEHFVEQRKYTEFAFERLERRMMEEFSALKHLRDFDPGRLDRLERKLDQFIDAQMRPASAPMRRARKP